ncbi:hypothetical protein [Streptomyces sp. Z26]|uniref:hypothetical protein n=1 Tax=Streptomyces sp. Z26 TaxID=2500177 RepID=UPI000FCBDBA2|nr:hypothetical protein [Streptomyces sp. Z26]
MRPASRFLSRAAVAAALAFAAVTGSATTSSAATAGDVGATEWKTYCGDGKACLYISSERVWNLPSCGVNHVNSYFEYAKAHGNGFRIYYTNGLTDTVARDSERTLDGLSLAWKVEVYC